MDVKSAMDIQVLLHNIGGSVKGNWQNQGGNRKCQKQSTGWAATREGRNKLAFQSGDLSST